MSDAAPMSAPPQPSEAAAVAGPRATQSLRARRLPLADPARQRHHLAKLAAVQPRDFERRVRDAGWASLERSGIDVFQINVGKLCNMTCRHCHVDAGPDRLDEVMSQATAEACIAALARTDARVVDLTGGAPELCPSFAYLVEAARGLGRHVIDRCNLTVLLAPRFAHLPEWLARHEVELVCSLPHYAARQTDAQRGPGTFEKSLEALKRLNAAGYGQGDPRRRLSLMTNPAGAFLPADQAAAEPEWRRALLERHGVHFDRLLTLNNMPIARFLEWLDDSGNLEPYMVRLRDSFNPEAVQGLMCRTTLSIGWDGHLYDCDFNQMLDLKLMAPRGSPDAPLHVNVLSTATLDGVPIRFGAHCFGCTAGAGSSCGGATT